MRDETVGYYLARLSAAELLLWYGRFGMTGLPREQRDRVGDLVAVEWRAIGIKARQEVNDEPK